MIRFDYFDAEKLLRAAGWKEAKSGRRVKRKAKDQRIYVKRYGPVWIEAIITTEIWMRSLMLYAPTPRTVWKLDKAEQDAIWDQLHARLHFEGLTTESVDKAARKLVEIYKKYAAPRKRTTHERFRWGGKTGPEAYKQWVSDVEEVILRELRRTKEHAKDVRLRRVISTRPLPLPFEKTHDVTMNVLSNYMMEPDLMPRTEARRKVRAILESLAKRGKITKIPAGEFDRNIWWEIKEGSGKNGNDNPRRRGKLPGTSRKKNPRKVTNVSALVRKALQ